MLYVVISWGNRIAARERNRINTLIKKAGYVIGLIPNSLDTISEKRPRRSVQTILQFEGHPLFGVFNNMKSAMSDQFRKPRCFTERFTNSFVPTAVKFLN